MSATQTITAAPKASEYLGPQPIDTTLNYVMPSTTVFFPGTAHNIRREEDTHPMRIADMRGREAEFTLDAQGFQPVMHEMAMDDDDYSNEELVKQVMYPDTVQLLKKHTGASKVHIYSHITRTHTLQQGIKSVEGMDDKTLFKFTFPVPYIHVDHSYDGAREALHDNIPAEEMEKLGNKRWAIINVWRPIHRPVERDPLAVADARTIEESDLKGVYANLPAKGSDNPLQKVSAGKGFESWHLLYNPKHKWYYWSDMVPGEALLLKIYDSKTSGGVARRSPHTAFKIPGTEDIPPRNSVECRCFVFWDDQTSE